MIYFPNKINKLQESSKQTFILIHKIILLNLVTVFIFPENPVFAQITPDNTLPNNSRITTQNNIQLIEGGTQAGNNLFHSLETFSLPTTNTAYFNNSPSIQNIITRVTGTSISNIEGTIRANGIANLFLINPNGIVFGEQASLNIGGSFIASTANSVNFADGSKFSTTTTPTPTLLTISTPIGLQFGQSPGSIINKSQASLNRVKNSLRAFPGLQVSPGKTLALVGGDIKMDGGNLTAPQGRIELGSVGSDSLVSLIPTTEGWTLGYEGVGNFQNIQLFARMSDTFIPLNSILTTTGERGNGHIRVKGDVVEIASSGIIDLNFSNNNGGDIAIDVNKLILRDGGQIVNSTIATGTGGKLTINAATSVDIIGIVDFSKETSVLSAIANTAYQTGDAGDITINTGKLNIRNGGTISVQSSGILIPPRFQELIPATGNAGNLTINATSIELAGKSTTNVPSRLIAETLGSGNAGKLTINTENLIVRDGADISVSSQVNLPPNRKYLGNPRNLGKAGDLTINTRSILLDSQGKIISQTDLGNGGNIILNVQNLLLMRRNSQISTSAGKVQSSGDGGNITIQSPNGFIVANQLENSDITANAYTGSGGKIKITATGIFGIAQRNREDLALSLGSSNPNELDPQKNSTSDITAISQTNPSLNGVVNLNTLDIDTNRGLIKLPQEPQEPKLSQGCKQIARNHSQFTITGRGGLPVNPRESLRNNTVNADWISLENLGERSHWQPSSKNNNISATPIMEAQGWIVNNRGEIFLVANTPKPTNQNSALVTPSCS